MCIRDRNITAQKVIRGCGEIINEVKSTMSQREEDEECSAKEVCDGMPERREKLKSYPQQYCWDSQNLLRSGLKVGNKGRAEFIELFSDEEKSLCRNTLVTVSY